MAQEMNDTTDGRAAAEARPAYHYSKHHLKAPRPIRIAVVGCGISGIGIVKMFKDRFVGQPVELTIYEKNKSVGGTWLENRYPGCSCDVPSHTYTFSWEANPYFSRVYAGSRELYDYFAGRAKVYGASQFVRLKHQVNEVTWNDAGGHYELSIKDLATGEIIADTAEVVINASGILNIPGIETFKGVMLHSANYDTSARLDDKVVGVIGTGSSGIQIVPQVQAIAKHLHTFHRSRTYVTPELGLEVAAGGRGTLYSKEQQERWASHPDELLEMRKRYTHVLNSGFEVNVKNSEAQRQTMRVFQNLMIERLSKKKELIPKLVPNFAVGCRRFTPGVGYLEALCEDNVTVHTDDIAEVVSNGIVMADGTLVELDVLICATGFNTSFLPPFRLTGQDGVVLNEIWKSGPRGYLGVAVPKFPNYFMTSGPNAPVSHGTFIPCVEAYINYAFDAIERLMTEEIKSITVTQDAVDDFQDHKDAIAQDLVWTAGCRSWYKNGTVDGKVWGPWPGSAPHFLESLAKPRWEDFHFKYRSGNRFQYLGNGQTKRELTGEDLSWFVTGSQPWENTQAGKTP